MKFIDTFNEDDKKKLTKKAKLIYSVLKKGTITRSDGVKFSYELGNNMVPSVVNGEIELFAFITKITERTYCPINEIAMSDLIIKKFEQFDIKVDLQIPKSIEIVKYQGKKPWEESLNEEIDIDKERNRVKTVHKAVRKGIVNVSGTRFRYELPEEYTFHVVDEPNLQVTAIKFTFYNKDLSRDNGGGHGLPLKIWRIEGGKDVYLNKMLTGQDVGDISYNDEYGINTKTGVEYVNAKNKVRNRYRNFNINAIMTTPSDTVMVNENHDENKLLRKGKAVYTALKSGKINYQRDEDNELARLTYTLSDERNIFISEEGGIWITPKKIKVREENKECLKISAGRVQDLIKEKFERFNISLNLRNFNPREDWDTWLGREGLNEEEEDNNITEKDRKKIELIYGLFKRGKYTVEDILYNYVLPDEYWIYDRNETGELIVVLTMDPTQKMKLYAKIKKEDGNLYHREVPVQATQYASLYDDAKKRIKEKFERFNIEIVF